MRFVRRSISRYVRRAVFRAGACVALGVCCLLLGSAPGLAVAGDGGFELTVEALYLRPANASPDYVIVDPDDDFDVEGSLRSIDFSGAVSPRITATWRVDGEQAIRLSYWNFDDDEDESVSSGGGLLWDTLSSPDIALLGYEGSATASYALDSTVIDFEYVREVLSDDTHHAGFTLGLRRLEHESIFSVVYASDTRNVYAVTSSEASGTGLRATAWGEFSLGGSWWIGGEIGYAMLLGDLDSSLLSYSLPAFPAVDIDGSRDRTFSTLDGRLLLGRDIGEHVTLHFGIVLARWLDTVEMPRFVDDVNPAVLQTDVSAAQWGGAVLGLSYRF